MRIFKTILMFVGLGIASQTSFAQYFQKLHDCDTSSDFGGNIFILQDDSYLAFSSSQSYTTNTRESVWLTLSSDGTNITTVKRLNSNSLNYYQGLNPGEVKKLDDGGYIVPVSFSWNGKSSLGLMRINAQLDTVFTKYYTDTTIYKENVAACAVMQNGDFIIGGYSSFNGMFIDSALVIRTDSDGNLLWKQKFKKISGEDASVLSLDVLDNDQILVGAMSVHIVNIGSDQYGHSPPWFMILNGAGNVVKDTIYNTLQYRGGGRIYKDMYGGYFHYGSYDSLYTTDPTDRVNFPEYIAHLNNNFDIDWVRNLGTWDGHKYIWRIEQLPDGNFQVSGASGTDQTWLKGWAARLDHNGWTIWDNDYTCDTNYSSYLVDFDVRQDGSLVLVGAARNDTVPSWRGQELWLVSVDANGCLVPGCDPTIVKTVEQKENADVLVYPNPANGLLNVVQGSTTFNTAVIINSIGQQLSIHQLAKENHLDISLLAPGLYYLQLSGERGREVRSFVKM